MPYIYQEGHFLKMVRASPRLHAVFKRSFLKATCWLLHQTLHQPYIFTNISSKGIRKMKSIQSQPIIRIWKNRFICFGKNAKLKIQTSSSTDIADSRSEWKVDSEFWDTKSASRIYINKITYFVWCMGLYKWPLCPHNGDLLHIQHIISNLDFWFQFQ